MLESCPSSSMIQHHECTLSGWFVCLVYIMICSVLSVRFCKYTLPVHLHSLVLLLQTDISFNSRTRIHMRSLHLGQGSGSLAIFVTFTTSKRKFGKRINSDSSAFHFCISSQAETIVTRDANLRTAEDFRLSFAEKEAGLERKPC